MHSASSVRLFVVAGGAWKMINGTLWREEDGGRATFLLAKMGQDVERLLLAALHVKS